MLRVMIVAGVLLGATCSRSEPEWEPEGATVAVTVRGHEITAEIAADPASREQGLMFRQQLPADAGMLFVFPDAAVRSFWMKNTYVPLSVAYLDDDREILNIERMDPLDAHTRHPSAGPARYALEVNQGWFEAHDVAPGDSVAFELPSEVDVR